MYANNTTLLLNESTTASLEVTSYVCVHKHGLSLLIENKIAVNKSKTRQ